MNKQIVENAKDEWMKIVKKHKRKQRGIPALSTLNTNAGNVEHNIAMFNKMNTPVSNVDVNPVSGPFSSGEGMGESLTTKQQELDDDFDVFLRAIL